MKRAIATVVFMLLVVGLAGVSFADSITRKGTIVCLKSSGQGVPCDGAHHSVMLDTLKEGKYILWGDKSVLDSLSKLKDKTGVTVTGDEKKGGPYYHTRIVIEMYKQE